MTAPLPQNPSALPSTPQAALEGRLEQLLQSLLEMGICASDVQESALETSVGGVASGYPGGLIGRKAAQTVDHLAELYALKDTVADVRIPLDVINYVDQGKNPHVYTREFIERVAGENMYTNGILSAVTDYRDILHSELGEAFPELAEYLKDLPDGPATNGETTSPAEAGGVNGEAAVRMEE
uniref:Mediator of RNA polymerase II transcription subunit 10 n=1 Tax=Leucosporidium scottii TaxID=5278 RepID=A0A0H5FU42_9BASI|nr:hypothetical protein ls5930a1_00036 [Leucosporidium scottii]